MERIKVRQAVIVEGKYDKIRLEPLLDGLILTTDGFRIYKDREKRELIRTLAKTCGIIILTDSDRAGFRLRGHLSGVVGEGEICHVYIPDIRGKEKRKARPSAEGKLGVEGMDPAVLREAFRKAGVLAEDGPAIRDPVTRQDFYEDGLMGGPDSAALRRALYRKLGLPAGLSTASALELLGRMVSRDEYRATLAAIKEETG